MDAGVRLIAERGYDNVSVGEIEEAAGFVARGGTLYKHFGSKSDLLQAAMGRHIDSLVELEGLDQFRDLPDLVSELTALGRWILRRLTREEQISKIIEKEGHRVPEIVDAMRDGISEPGYSLLAAYLTERGMATSRDGTAIAVLLLGGLINVRRSTWTFGQPPAGVTDDRAIAAWVDICTTVLEAPPR